MRTWIAMTSLSMASSLAAGCASPPAPPGLAFRAETRAGQVYLLVDETWTDADGNRQVEQEIFGEVFAIIDEAEQFLLLDLFLVNDFNFAPGPGLRPLAAELAERLLAKRRADPLVEIVFITDPINTVYGSVPSPHFEALEAAGVRVAWTNLDALRDSNPLYSKPWRLLAKPWGAAPGRALPNPLGEGRISVRSMLRLLNFKANHRKLVVSEKSLLVASANPHGPSSAHWNTALRVDGAGQAMALEAEAAILRLSGTDAPAFPGAPEAHPPPAGHRLELLTEIRIKEKALAMLDGAAPGARIDLAMFYLSDRDVVKALAAAAKRGCGVRVVLDPNKDAFGRTKNGIPNRQSAARLVAAGVPLRWADTRGEQFHVKMLYAENPDGTATLLLGSSNFTRRNLDNFNAEADLALTAPAGRPEMQKARDAFDRWWTNPDGRTYTAAYAAYEDRSLLRKFLADFMEATGMGTF